MTETGAYLDASSYDTGKKFLRGSRTGAKIYTHAMFYFKSHGETLMKRKKNIKKS